MTLLDISQEELDRFGPYGSGLGAVAGGIIFLATMEYFPPACLLIPALSFVFCTCTHRRYLVGSWAALAGAFGSMLGLLISSPIWGVLFMFLGRRSLWAVALIEAPIVFASTFLMSRYACRRQRRKAGRLRQS